MLGQLPAAVAGITHTFRSMRHRNFRLFIIGQVVSTRRVEVELFQQAVVQPAVDFARLEIVLVITNFRPVDISPLVPTLTP